MADYDVRAITQRQYEEGKWLEGQPQCCVCHEHIQDEHCYLIDGEIVCEDCISDYADLHWRVRTEDQRWDRFYG